MRSRLYTGTVAHARTRPARNSFRYPIYYLAVDLDELDELDAGLTRFSHNRGNLVSLWDRDHGPRDGSALRPWIDAQCSRAGIDLTGGHVVLLTFPRVLGARFYPVTFWYCFGADDEPLAVLAEVHNTYRDRHNYLLHNRGERFDWASRPTMDKAFFVSPFMPTEGVRYEFEFTAPGDTAIGTVRDIIAGEVVLTSTITLSASELTDRTLTRTVLAHGPISIVALLRIHYQALKLIVKRVPIHPHKPPPAEETSL